MACSPAQLAANRANALHSTGPRTEAGKARSRRNSLQHGLTGEGIVLPTEDVAAVEERFADFAADFRPRGGVARFLVKRAALLSVRLDRAALHEAASLSVKIQEVEEEHDRADAAAFDQLVGSLGDDPATKRRDLIGQPEGIDWLVAELFGCRGELAQHEGYHWSLDRGRRLNELCGRPSDHPAGARVRGLSLAFEGDASGLEPGEAVNLDDRARRSWARDRLIGVIDAEIAALEQHRRTLDHGAIERERQARVALALFDASPEAVLARQYEAAAERSLFRIFKQIRAAEPEVAAPQPDEALTLGPADCDLGSFFPDVPPFPPTLPPRPRRPVPAPVTPVSPLTFDPFPATSRPTPPLEAVLQPR